MLIVENFLFALIILFPFYIFTVYRDASGKRQKSMVESAIQKGNVVKAIKIKQGAYNSEGPDYMRGKYRAVYEYRVKGKKYKFILWDSTPPLELTLYYLKNPRKATLSGAMSSEKTNWPLMVLIVTALLYCLS